MTTPVLNTKTTEVENKTYNFSGLVKKADNAKTPDTEQKYLTTSDYDKFTHDILD